jgi:hypothetical protein
VGERRPNLPQDVAATVSAPRAEIPAFVEEQNALMRQAHFTNRAIPLPPPTRPASAMV